MKYLVLVAVAVAVWLLWRGLHRRADGAGRTPAPPPATAALPQDMVRCAVCALHLPRLDALADGQGRHFCSAEHRDSAGPAPGG